MTLSNGWGPSPRKVRAMGTETDLAAAVRDLAVSVEKHARFASEATDLARSADRRARRLGVAVAGLVAVVALAVGWEMTVERRDLHDTICAVHDSTAPPCTER